MTDPGSPQQVTLDATVVASPDQVSSDLAGETVLLSMTSARYYGFEGVGPRIWELVAKPVRVSDVCAAISTEYDVTRERCESDVLTFLRDLATKGLLEVRFGG